MVMRFGQDLRCSYVNPIVEEYTGVHREQLLGKSGQETGAFSQCVETWEAALRQVFSTGRPVTKEFTFQTPKGVRDYDSRFIPEAEDAGHTRSVLSITRDWDIHLTGLGVCRMDGATPRQHPLP